MRLSFALQTATHSAEQKEIEDVTQRLKEALEQEDLSHFTALINDLGITCPVSGSKNWTEVRRFNLMFHTQLGNISGEESKLYLRPETAQGIFVNFLNTLNSTRQKIPFGIAQTGKAFEMRLLRDNSYLECVNLNRWKCNFLFRRVQVLSIMPF